MTRIKRAACILSLVAASSVGGMAAVVHAQDARGNDPAPEDAASTLIRQMAGTWNVRQRMWPGLGAEAVDLPPAVARRHMKAGGFLEEVMKPAKGSEKASFTRTAFFNYNAVNRQYEYFSLDSRAPQMMNERSDKIEWQGNPGQSGIELNGGTFVAPQWGEARNVAFAYRLTVGAIESDNQVVQLYLTPQTGESPKEFLAFEYVYTRQR